MDLKEFIKLTLVQIQEGVQEAIDHRSSQPNSAGAINPVWGIISGDHLQRVEFDVAVTVLSKSADMKVEGLTVAGISSAEESSNNSENNTISRIKFLVPIIPPVQSVRR